MSALLRTDGGPLGRELRGSLRVCGRKSFGDLGRVGLTPLRVAVIGAADEIVTMLLERLRVVAALPWTARAAEQVDIEAAMAELEAGHAGRPSVKGAHPPATRRLTRATWTAEGRGHAVRSCRRDSSAPAPLRRLVVRPARPAALSGVYSRAGFCSGGTGYPMGRWRVDASRYWVYDSLRSS